MNVEFPLDIL